MIVFRYLAREILTTLVAVTLVMMLIMISSWIIRLLGPVAAGEETLGLVMWILIYRLPYFLELILPLALFIAILLAYARMYSENEMTVFIATGTSENRLLAYTLMVAAIIALVVAFLTLYLSPWGAQQRVKVYALQAQVSEFDLLIAGRFQSFSNDKRVTYVQGISSDKHRLQDVFIADENSFTLAASGQRTFNPKTGSAFLELSKGRQYKINDKNLAVESLQFDSYGLKLPKPPKYHHSLRKETISTLDLFTHESPKHKSQLYWRFSLIAMVFISTLLAFPLAKVRPRQGRYAKLFPAFLLFMVYLASLISMINMMAEEELPSDWLIIAMHLFYLGLSLLLIYGATLKSYFKKQVMHAHS